MALTGDELRLREIFHPYAFKKLSEIQSNGTRFVHYTQGAAAMNMLRTKEVWMRKTSCMDDYTEVQHGLECLIEAYKSDKGKLLQETLESLFSGICIEIENLFNGWMPRIQTGTYIVCMSEHADAEDTIGRLSMWRAYGSGTGVAVVMNNTAFLGQSDALRAYSSPVAYMTNKEVELQLEDIANAIQGNSELIQQQGRKSIIGRVFHAFKFATLCTKHPGFAEEREWRVVHSPEFEPSERLTKSIEVIGGVPQPVYKIPLHNVPEENFFGADVDELIERIIIGPTQYPFAQFEAFVQLLTDAGVKNPEKRVKISDIPLR